MHPNNPALLLKSRAAAIASGLTLDNRLTGIKAAYSTRKLLTAYAGSALQVQRTSDNATLNIGFVGNVLDTSSLSTFVSAGGAGTTGRVITWYDQSGGGNNLTQALSNAPIIYTSAGAINFINSTRPAMDFAGVCWFVNGTLSANPTNTLFQNAVVVSSTAANQNISGPSANGGLVFLLTSSFQLDFTKAFVVDFATSTGTAASGTASVVEADYDGTTAHFWIDGAAAGTVSSSQSFSAATFQLGSQNTGTQNFAGKMGEYIAYDQVGSCPYRTAIEADQKSYWGTP